MVSDIGKLPFPEGSAARIECYHVIEHLPHRLVPRMLREWRRVLKTGGELIVECPDFDRTVQEYLEGHEGRIYNVFGLQRFPGDAHLFGYNRKRLRRILEDAGFREVEDREPSDYHTREEACLRIECRK